MMKPSKLKKCCLLCLLLLLLLHSLVMNAQKYSITYKIDQQIDFLVCHLSDTLTGVSSLQDAGIYYSKEQTLLHLIEMKFKIQIADCDSLYLYHKTLFKKTKNKQDQVNTEYYRVSKEVKKEEYVLWKNYYKQKRRILEKECLNYIKLQHNDLSAGFSRSGDETLMFQYFCLQEIFNYFKLGKNCKNE